MGISRTMTRTCGHLAEDRICEDFLHTLSSEQHQAIIHIDHSKGAYHGALRIFPRADFWFFFLWELIFPRNAYHRHQFLGKSKEWFSMKTSDPRNRSDPVSWIWFSPTWCSHKHTRQSFLSGTRFCHMRKSKVCSTIALFLNAENLLWESPKTNGTGPNIQAPPWSLTKYIIGGRWNSSSRWIKYAGLMSRLLTWSKVLLRLETAPPPEVKPFATRVPVRYCWRRLRKRIM
jgi:hypothetical protein